MKLHRNDLVRLAVPYDTVRKIGITDFREGESYRIAEVRELSAPAATGRREVVRIVDREEFLSAGWFEAVVR